MLRVTLDNVAAKRTIQPLYAHHQATPYGAQLDPEFDREADILPGMVMTRLGGETAGLFGHGPAAATHTVWGLSGLFVAPKFGIDEIRPTGLNNFAVWVGDNQSVFEILAPAFDTTATWENTEDGSATPLRVTLAGHAEGPGKLTTAASGANVSTAVAAHLIKVVGTNKIIVNLDQTAPAAAGTGA